MGGKCKSLSHHASDGVAPPAAAAARAPSSADEPGHEAPAAGSSSGLGEWHDLRNELKTDFLGMTERFGERTLDKAQKWEGESNASV